MDSIIKSNNCDGVSTPSQPNPILLPEHGSTISIIDGQEPSQQTVIDSSADVILPDTGAIPEGDEGICCEKNDDNIAVILDQQVLVKPLQKDAEILIDGIPNTKISNKNDMNDVADYSTKTKIDPEPNVGEQISEKPSTMIIDEQNYKPSINKMSSDSQVRNDNLMHASVLDNCSEEIPPTDALVDIQSDVILENFEPSINKLTSDSQVRNDNLMHASVLDNCSEEIPPTDAHVVIQSDIILENFKPSINKPSSDSEVRNDNLMHASVLDNCSEEIPPTDANVDIQSDVILSPSLTTVKSEQESDLNQSSSLALLAQYDTEDDSDDDVREISVPQTYQNRCVEIDSDSSASDVEFLSEIRNAINLDRLDVDNEDEDDDDEDEGNIRNKRQPKVKGELHLEDLPPIEDLHITVPEEECTELGSIHSIVEQLVLVNALPGTVPLDLETVLFRDKGTQVLGEVFDVLGQVSDPLYCVRFNSNKEIIEKGIEVGQIVYVAPRTEHTQFVVLANLMKIRGSDASWENDVEPPPRFIDYSDDEEERSARRPNRKRQSSGGVTSAGRGSYTPRRPYRGNYSSHGGVRQPYQSQENYNIVGNSWHSNFYQPQMFNQPQYRMPPHFSGGYMRPILNNSPYQQPPPVNPGLVINPYAVYPPPPVMQHPLFPHSHHQHPPPQ